MAQESRSPFSFDKVSAEADRNEYFRPRADGHFPLKYYSFKKYQEYFVMREIPSLITKFAQKASVSQFQQANKDP